MVVNIRDLAGLEVLIILILLLIPLLAGIANWMGHYNIVISAGGNDRKPLYVEMSKIREGRAFAEAVKYQITNQ